MSKKRGSFSGGLGFVFAAAGSAVGLGNLWRFPYYAAKYGGGTFIFIYIILALTFGFSLLTAEIAIGRKTKLSPILAYKKLCSKFSFCTGTCCPCGTGQLFLGLYFRPVVTHCVFLNIYAVECSGNYARSKQRH